MQDASVPAQAIAHELAYTVDLVRTFLGWRHNVLTRFAVAASALGAAAYLTDARGAEGWSVVACATGAAFSLTALALDRRNAQMLRRLAARASALEAQLAVETGRPRTPGSASFFREWHGDDRTPLTYTHVLRAVYGTALVVFASLALL